LAVHTNNNKAWQLTPFKEIIGIGRNAIRYVGVWQNDRVEIITQTIKGESNYAVVCGVYRLGTFRRG
jgi:hypothetical protein